MNQVEVDQTVRQCFPGSIRTTGQATPVRHRSRSARDRVSNQRIGRSCSRGRSCLAQLPRRSCKIKGTSDQRPALFPLLPVNPRTRLVCTEFQTH